MTEKREELHLFTDDDGNTYAARDLSHAKELWTADTGQPAEDSGEWTAIPDDKEITIDDEVPGQRDMVRVTKKALEWAAEMVAPGCCYSVNY